MALIPLRKIGQLGLNTDFDPRTLPLGAWTEARNVSFEKGSISRAPQFRVAGKVTYSRPSYVTGHAVPNGSYEFIIGFRDGRVVRWNAKSDTGKIGIETNLTAESFAPFEYPEATTSAVLQDVLYLNRPDRPLWAMTKAGDRFKPVVNWNPNWRCKAIRSINGQTVAIGVSRDGRFYPTMIKASDFAAYGYAGAEWVATTTNSASENILGELGERLIDGCPLRNRMYLYSENETWSMTPTLTNSIYDYDQAFPDKGVISQNCVLNVSNTHYVFGPHGIWDLACPHAVAQVRS